MNTLTSIYQDIAKRTAGDIYIGVVGPARTGKSTFIKRFMETLVIPHIDNVYRKERALSTNPPVPGRRYHDDKTARRSRFLRSRHTPQPVLPSASASGRRQTRRGPRR